ncbi:hypothetical protein GALMADRAFT_272755 [Galerina marginata CBS 339.88]|uniref:Protein kinase domain-containing protein n=1 Tax=Galerina marginata (strain CBS 339.88) TaxID=685588 RepID=A0A067SB95_GALM3|nr:hypothetical protein GALMADRAFT_272755 [Galerina marginata CBS 339.88]
MSQFPEEPLHLGASDGFGYFPAYPGLKLNENRYEVIRKLGYGPKSSTWLILDLTGDREYLALKILTAHITAQETNELQNLQIIQQAGYFSLPRLNEHFVESSHHGQHLCLGFTVLASSVEELRLSSPTKSLPIHIVQKIVSDVAQQILQLHACDMIHGAMIADNFRFIGSQTKEDLDDDLADLPPCVIERKIVVADIEYPIVLSQPVPHECEWNSTAKDMADAIIQLDNLGHAQLLQSKPTWEESKMDRSLRPPEVILGMGYGGEVDIWMFGASVYQLLTGEPLVPVGRTQSDADQLGWLVAMSGDSLNPESALSKPEVFDKDGVFLGAIPEETLENRLLASGRIPGNDIAGVLTFLNLCLRLEPAQRISSKDIVLNQWVMDGGACSCCYDN